MPLPFPLRRIGALVVLTAALGSCVRAVPAGQGVAAGTPERDRRGEPALLYIQNNHWADVTIWAVTGGQRNRVGIVGAARSGEFVLPPSAMNRGGEMRLMVTALANRRPHTSELIVVRPSGLVEWTLESRLERSFLSVY